VLPSRRQYRRWSLPSKWTFWAGLIGIVSLIFTVFGLIPDRSENRRYEKRVASLVLQASQELRYNSQWLSRLARNYEDESPPLPIGRMKTDALVELANIEFTRIVRYSYGEEKYIYQEIYQLADLAAAFGSPSTRDELESFDERSNFTLHDIIFLNDFLWWYLTPLAEDSLDSKQLYSMGWAPFPREGFTINGVEAVQLRNFVIDGQPIEDFGHYLGLLD
jgi:hypothetical protein